ncbi:hypothetical protein GQ42DRAFT_173538 [Ramicandelaber brevisporus]|nr:hypothetical protein GQ42DRAFT_173538 [Ramicandelaber brevisporus]
MGNCFSSSSADDTGRTASSGSGPNVREVGGSGSPALNSSSDDRQLLPRAAYAWTSNTPMTMAQLQSRRDEFWETAPSYDGKPEIWQALRNVCEADDQALQRTILESAQITCPSGNLTDGAYDILGNRYVVPNYCIIPPRNLIAADTDATTITGGISPITAAAAAASTGTVAAAGVSGADADKIDAATFTTGPKLLQGEKPISITVRMSTGKDVKLQAGSTETLGNIRLRLLHNEGVDPHIVKNIKFFYLGKLLKDTSELKKDVGITSRAVLQALVSS